MRWLKYHKIYILLLISFASFCVKAQNSQYKDASSELEIPTEEQLIKDDPDPVVMSAQIAVR
ncbi:MAG: hypothetical protein KA174_07110, partial [Chitinophagales bacterium]|nr:hypothetical protein [Chitinophagales bacterium]